VTDVRKLLKLNALRPIVSTDAGMLIEVRPVETNVESLIYLSAELASNVTDVRVGQS